MGLPVLAHGLDQFITGINAAITRKRRATLTEHLLQKAGMASEWASFTNDAISLLATVGAGTAWKAGNLRGYSKAALPKE